MMQQFRHTVTVTRPAETAGTDEWGNPVGEARTELVFEAAWVPPTTQAGSRIIDAPLTEVTITKPTLYVDRRPSNAPVFESGALRTGDYLTIGGDARWQIDGDPADFTHPWTGWEPPLVVELRKRDGG